MTPYSYIRYLPNMVLNPLFNGKLSRDLVFKSESTFFGKWIEEVCLFRLGGSSKNSYACFGNRLEYSSLCRSNWKGKVPYSVTEVLDSHANISPCVVWPIQYQVPPWRATASLGPHGRTLYLCALLVVVQGSFVFHLIKDCLLKRSMVDK